MQYEILYPEAFPVVSVSLQKGEAIKVESGAMIAMDATLSVEGKMEGGFLKGLVRKTLTGESFFLQRIVADNKGRALLGHTLPGGIQAVHLDGSDPLIVSKNGFLAATEDIEVDSKIQSLSKGLFSKEGFFLVKLSGRGTAFVSSYGVIHPIRIEEGREVIIDNGHLVAWPESMDYSVEKASKGIMSSFTSGEGLVCRFRGPGVVYIQTRNLGAFEDWIRSIAPSGGSSSHSSTASSVLSLFDSDD